MVTFAAHKMTLVQIVHSEVGKPIPNRQSFAKHHQTCQRQPFPARLAVFCIAAKIPQECLVVVLVPNMGAVLLPELRAVLAQRILVNVIHSIILYQNAIVSLCVESRIIAFTCSSVQ